jgi:hypothetical protein
MVGGTWSFSSEFSQASRKKGVHQCQNHRFTLQGETGLFDGMICLPYTHHTSVVVVPSHLQQGNNVVKVCICVDDEGFAIVNQLESETAHAKHDIIHLCLKVSYFGLNNQGSIPDMSVSA